MKGAISQPRVPKYQPPAYVNQAPVSGTKYEWSSDGTQTNKLGALSNVRLMSIVVSVTWTVQPTPLEVHVTIDGETIVFTLTNPATATDYVANFVRKSANGVLSTLAVGQNMGNLMLEGRSVKVECETTGGTVSNITMYVRYAKW